MPPEGTPGPGPATTPERVDAADEAAESGDSGLADAEARIAELENLWLRALADLDNLRKRHEREMERARSEERMRVAAEWLPVIDNLERALGHAESDPSGIIEGVQAVRDQAVALLGRLGFPRRDEVGGRFDPTRHEAVGVVAAPDAEAGTVIQVLRPGYGEGEQQLRPAAVVVATGPS
jgi:molecular chaperone GrpE